MANFSDNQDNRRHSRISAEEDFQGTSWAFVTDGIFASLFRKRYPASIIDISEGGLGLLCNQKIDVNSNIAIHIKFRDFEPFQVEGRVRVQKVLGTAELDGQTVTYYQTGVHLELLPPLIQNYMQKIVTLMKSKDGVTYGS